MEIFSLSFCYLRVSEVSNTQDAGGKGDPWSRLGASKSASLNWIENVSHRLLREESWFRCSPHWIQPKELSCTSEKWIDLTFNAIY